MMVNGGELIGVEWRSAMYGTIGIVAIQFEHYWMAYMGPVEQENENFESLAIIKIGQWGAKLSKVEAMAFFPTQDPKKYKYQ